MSLDRSLKTGGSLVQHRNVLTRSERISKMKEADAWDDDSNPLGLPKMISRKPSVGKKPKKTDGDEDDAVAEESD